MRCPYCGLDDDRVIDSRSAEEGDAVRRRRACRACGQRFSTYERVEQPVLRVRKRSGDLELFDRDKVASGILRATKNLEIEPSAVRRAVARVEGSLRDHHRHEVPSEEVGLEVLLALRELHEVAYVRFASVYKSFTRTEDFERELATLGSQEPGADAPDVGETARDDPPAEAGAETATGAPET
ncbi:MAG: transcriptional regulator NrdR [Actinomycetota bacterium]